MVTSFEKDFQLVEVEIQYFRSIYKLELNNLNRMVVITGTNDIGKSNILRALNLFFNGFTEEGKSFDFKEEFCHFKKAEGQIKKDTTPKQEGKRIRVDEHIKIQCVFKAPREGWQTVPIQKNTPTKRIEYIKIFKQWSILKPVAEPVFSYGFLSAEKKIKTVAITDRSKFEETRFLNKFRFVYLPTCKDSESIRNMIQSVLRDGLEKNRNVFTGFYENEIFNSLPKIRGELMSLTAPADLSSFVTSAIPKTNNEKQETFGVSLFNRGQGIQAMYLLTLLKEQIKQARNKVFIIGFEEPEAFLEARNVDNIFTEMLELSTHKDVQFFVTTHSPIFYAKSIPVETERQIPVSVFHCSQDIRAAKFEDRGTIAKPILSATEVSGVDEVLGINFSVGKQMEEWIQKNKHSEQEIKSLKEELTQLKSPTIYCEGKYDLPIIKLILKEFKGLKYHPLDGKTNFTHLKNIGLPSEVKQNIFCILDPDATNEYNTLQKNDFKVFIFDKSKANILKNFKISGLGLELFYSDSVVVELSTEMQDILNSRPPHVQNVPEKANLISASQYLNDNKQKLCNNFQTYLESDALEESTLNSEFARLKEEVRRSFYDLNSQGNTR
jgi:AAA15 family ATPase/GTPase